MKRRILLISYHFPPSAEVGGLRIANFARRLPRFGWEPHVLTVKDRYLESTDPDRARWVEQAGISKAGLTPTLSQAYLACKKLSGYVRKAQSAQRGEALQVSPGADDVEQRGESPRARARRYVLSFLMLPDAYRNWIALAVVEALRIIRREQIQCILTSCPPYSVHLVGLLVKRMAGVKHWIADFRDPWMTMGGKVLYPTCAASLAIDRWMERQVVRNADLVVANTEPLCEGFRRAYDALPANRFTCIENGFDSEYFSQLPRVRKDDLFAITYTGTLYFGRSPEPVFEALRRLVQEGSLDPGRVRVRLVGHCGSLGGRPMSEVIRRYRLDGIAEALEPVPYHRAIAMVRQSHLALLLAPDQPYQVPAKVYDYMGAGTRVLAIANEGATAGLIRSTGIGAVFAPADIPGIKDYIHLAYREYQAARQWISPPSVGQFELDEISRRLAQEIDRLYAAAPAPRGGVTVPSRE